MNAYQELESTLSDMSLEVYSFVVLALDIQVEELYEALYAGLFAELSIQNRLSTGKHKSKLATIPCTT